MIRTQIYLTESEKEHLETIALTRGVKAERAYSRSRR